jgi:hypothetical protein
MDHTNTPVADKLAFQIARERSVQLEQKEM